MAVHFITINKSATMSNLVLLFFILLFQEYNQYSAFAKDSFIAKPDKEVYSHEGSDVTLEWDLNVGSSSSSPHKVCEFLFGTWVSPGFVSNIILAVQGHNVVSKMSGFERKVDWTGNIYDCEKCNAKIKMYNLTSADFTTYGVEVELGGFHRNPLTNWLKLVKFEPTKIIKWQRRIKVEEGNATSIECKATGRPTPSVIIQTNNRTLCNSTGYCVYRIPAAKPVHEGYYLCLVQQRNSSQIRLSLNLTVLEGQTTPETDMEDNRTTNNTPEHDTLMSLKLVMLYTALVVVIVIMIFVCLYRSYRACTMSRVKEPHYNYRELKGNPILSLID